MEEEKGFRSLRSDDSMVVVSADKRGATVIMDKTDYVNKANQAFNDREAYTPIAEDPTKKQAASIKKKVNELTRKKLINPADSKFLTPNDTRIARAYGLPKVHKAASTYTLFSSLARARCQDRLKKTGDERGRRWMARTDPHLGVPPHPLVHTTNNQDFNQRDRDLEAGTAEAAPRRAADAWLGSHTVMGVP
nr:unnamed protein product [Spirometra erinaceieuropaei]